MPGFREKVVTDGLTNGRTNMGDLIGPNPTKVGGPKSEKTNGGKYENFCYRLTDRQTFKLLHFFNCSFELAQTEGVKLCQFVSAADR